MKTNFLLLAFMVLAPFYVLATPSQLKKIGKPRVVILTDVSTWETDDSESLVRLMVYADMLEIEGLIYTTGWSLDETCNDFFQLIHNAIDAYEKDLPSLMKRSGQVGFLADESQQEVGYWPSADYLRQRTVFGSKRRGLDQIGAANTSDGSNLIIHQADEEDDRPLWILLWGGGNTLAQSIWQVQHDRDAEGLEAFLKKIPTYAITDQDRSYVSGTPFHISSHQWLRHEFENKLLFIWDECAWKYQNGTGREKWEDYAQHIQGHGNLGLVYPKYKFGVEGDTPSFLHVLPNGLNDPLIPTQVSWGGYSEWGLTADDTTFAYTNHKGLVYKVCHDYEAYFYPAVFNDFAARMDWAATGQGNRNPCVTVNGVPGFGILHLNAKAGEVVTLDASGSYDQEGNALSFKWWIQPEAGSLKQSIEIEHVDDKRIRIKLPKDSGGQHLHVICEVADNGVPSLTSYRRIVVDVLN